MAASLEQVLNVVVPIGVILGFLALMYWKMSGPFNVLGGWIKKLFGSAGGGIMSIFESKPVTEITYK